MLTWRATHLPLGPCRRSQGLGFFGDALAWFQRHNGWAGWGIFVGEDRFPRRAVGRAPDDAGAVCDNRRTCCASRPHRVAAFLSPLSPAL